MNWDAVIAVVEVVGLITIVGSLIYVGVQTRQANNHAIAASTIAWMDGWNQHTPDGRQFDKIALLQSIREKE
jgi:hypothetical protein